MEQIFLFSSIAGVIAIIYGFITAKQVLNMPSGDKKMRQISGAIQEGASAYLKRQYITISFVGILRTFENDLSQNPYGNFLHFFHQKKASQILN